MAAPVLALPASVDAVSTWPGCSYSILCLMLDATILERSLCVVRVCGVLLAGSQMVVPSSAGKLPMPELSVSGVISRLSEAAEEAV